MMTGLFPTAALAFVAMAVAWRIAVATGRFSWIDAIWSFAVGGCGMVTVLAAPAAIGETIGLRRVLIASLAACWSLRLGLHLVQRSLAGGNDPRYLQLQSDWGGSFPRRLFWFLQVQAAVAWALAFSLGIAAGRPAPTLDLSDWLGFAIAATAIAGEHIADRQLAHFRATAGDRTEGHRRICSGGLWGLSRHPNYFFEWLFWVGIALIGFDFPGAYHWSWLGSIAPALMYWLLVHVSGIPPLEAYMLRSRGQDYRAYQDNVNAFWPWPHRRSA